MASQVVCDLGERLVNEINKCSSENKLNCGDVIELICILNVNVADWLSKSLKVDSGEILDDIATLSHNCHDTFKGEKSE